MNYYLALLQGVLKNPTWDVLLALFFLTAGFIWGSMGGGRAKLLSFLFATYVSLSILPVVFTRIDLYEIGIPHPYRNLVLYGVSFGVLFVLFQKNIFYVLGKSSYRWWQALLMSFLAVGLFMAGSLNIINFHGIIKFSRFTNAIFAGKNAYVFWSLSPLFGIAITARAR